MSGRGIWIVQVSKYHRTTKLIRRHSAVRHFFFKLKIVSFIYLFIYLFWQRPWCIIRIGAEKQCVNTTGLLDARLEKILIASTADLFELFSAAAVYASSKMDRTIQGRLSSRIILSLVLEPPASSPEPCSGRGHSFSTPSHIA